MDFSIWGEYIGGALVALYAIWNIVNKFLDQTAGRKKKIEEIIIHDYLEFYRYYTMKQYLND